MTIAVYRGMDQATLDAAYNNLAAVANSAAIIQSWVDASQVFRQQCAPIELCYGPMPRQTIDYFATESDHAPLLVFIHGGYWQRNHKTMFSHVAAGLSRPPIAADAINVAIIGYSLAPQVSLKAITEEVDSAIAYLDQHHRRLGFNHNRLLLGGWSAGAHLAALAADNTRVAAVICVSGIFDLQPIALSYLNEHLNLGPEEINTLSPCTKNYHRPNPIYLYVGDSELPEPQRQSATFAALLTQQNIPCQLENLKAHNHFSIMNELTSPQGSIAANIRRLAFEHTR